MNVRQVGIGLALLFASASVSLITGCGGTAPAAASSTSSTTVTPPAIAVTVSPATANVFTSATAQFAPTVTGTTNTGVAWSVNGLAGGNQTIGTISDSGLYTAPSLVPTPALVTVTATSAANSSVSGSAQVKVATPIVINLSPAGVTLLPGAGQSFTATVSGPVSSGVTWSVDGVVGGNSTLGTLVTTRTDVGLSIAQYTAPGTSPVAQPLIVRVISTVDPAAFAAARVFIRRDNQFPQAAPIKLGTSGGNASDLLMNGGNIGGCCSGTLGSLLSRAGTFYILSNNHVLDKSDQGSTGDPIVQPGLGDANCQVQNTATVAHLSQAAPLQSNVDAAMAAIVPGEVDTSGTILDLNGPNQPAPPSSTLADVQTALSSKEPVAKVGRSSGVTCGSIESISADIIVHYETSCGSKNVFQVSYTNQIIVAGGIFSEPGDSGSLVVTADTARPLGILYAGDGSSTAVNPIQDVLSALKDPSTGEIPQVVGGADHAVGCPNSGQATIASAQALTAKLNGTVLEHAQLVKAQYETQLLQYSAVSTVSVGASEDDPGQPAVVVHVKSSAQTPIPHEVGGVRTKVVFDQPTVPIPLSKSVITNAMQIKNQHSAELRSNPRIFGVGVAASKDSPGEAAIVVYVDRSSTISIPMEIDALRTQVVRTDPFRTSGWGKDVPSACSKPTVPKRLTTGRIQTLQP